MYDFSDFYEQNENEMKVHTKINFNYYSNYLINQINSI